MLDIDTLRAAQVAIGLAAMVLVLFGTYRTSRAPFAGWWAVVVALSSLSSVLYLLDGEGVRDFGAALGNGVAGIGGAAIWMSARSLADKQTPLYLYITPGALAAVATAIESPQGDAWPGGATVLITLSLTVGLCAYELLRFRRVPDHRGERTWGKEADAAILAMTVVSVFASAFYLYRFVSYFAAGPSSEFYQVWAGPTLTTLVVMIILVVVTYSVAELSRVQVAHHWRLRAHHDDLTGLLNRDAFRSQGVEILRRSLAHGGAPAVVVADFDHFKSVNDEQGHRAGDLVLRRFGQACAQVLGDGDIAGRMGGEEFVLLVRTGAEAGARRLIADLLAAFAADWEADAPVPTISSGIALAAPHLDLDEAVAMADEAMYDAKRDGRNRIAVHGH